MHELLDWFDIQGTNLFFKEYTDEDVKKSSADFLGKVLAFWKHEVSKFDHYKPWMNVINYTVDSDNWLFNAKIIPPSLSSKKFEICINAGVLLASRDLCLVACGCKEFMPETWPLGIQNLNYLIENKTRYYDYSFLKELDPKNKAGAMTKMIPWDQNRIRLAFFLMTIVITWVIIHEEGHVMGGHLHWLRSLNKTPTLSLWDERLHLFNKSASVLINKAIEMDADIYAAQGVVDTYMVNQENYKDIPYMVYRNKEGIFRLVLIGLIMGPLIFEFSRINSNLTSINYPTPYSRLLSVIRAAIGRMVYGTSGNPPLQFDLSTCLRILAKALGDVSIICQFTGILNFEEDLIYDISYSLFNDGLIKNPPKSSPGKEFLIVDNIHKTQLKELAIFNKKAYDWALTHN